MRATLVNPFNCCCFVRRFLLLLGICLVAGCTPKPAVIDNSQRTNSGVNIVPEAVLAATKLPPSNAPTSSVQPDVINAIVSSEQKHDTLMKLLTAARMVPMLQEAGPYTILAPTDEAFDKLPPGVIDRLLLPSHRPQLISLLKYHLLSGRITAADLQETNGQVRTLQGSDVIIRGIGEKVMINDANVIQSDASASNGVVHWIDTVLLPPV